MVVYYLGTNIFFFIFYKQGYLNFFKYLIILFFFFINKYLTILLSISGPHTHQVITKINPLKVVLR